MNFEDRVSKIEKNIKYTFKDKTSIKRAITHSSFTNENKGDYQNYERLEFLGDSVLGMIVAKYLYENFSNINEGIMTKIRASVVCEESLAKCARDIEINQVLVLSKGESLHGGQEKDSILADVFEAVLASIYLDSDFETAQKFVLSHLKNEIDSFCEKCDWSDYKSELQEILQKGGRAVEIKYVLDDATGPDHDRTFFMSVWVDGKKMGNGIGKNKKAAQQDAAKNAILEVNKSEDFKV